MERELANYVVLANTGSGPFRGVVPIAEGRTGSGSLDCVTHRIVAGDGLNWNLWIKGMRERRKDLASEIQRLDCPKGSPAL